MIIAVGQVVPAVGVAEGVCGEPLAVVGAVVPQQEGVAEASALRLAGEEGALVLGVAEGGQGDGPVAVAAERPQGGAQQVVEEDSAVTGENRAAAVGVRLVEVALVAAAHERQAVPEELLGTIGISDSGSGTRNCGLSHGTHGKGWGVRDVMRIKDVIAIIIGTSEAKIKCFVKKRYFFMDFRVKKGVLAHFGGRACLSSPVTFPAFNGSPASCAWPRSARLRASAASPVTSSRVGSAE